MVEEAQTQVVKTLIERRVHHGFLIVTPAGSLHVQEVTCQNSAICQPQRTGSDLSKRCNMPGCSVKHPLHAE